MLSPFDSFSLRRRSQMDSHELRSGCSPEKEPPEAWHSHRASPEVPSGHGITAVVPGRVQPQSRDLTRQEGAVGWNL